LHPKALLKTRSHHGCHPMRTPHADYDVQPGRVDGG
jgi:hypothetical protein